MKWLKHKLIQYLIKHLLVALTTEDILTITNKGVYIGNRRLSQEELMQLKEEARDFQASYIWRLMTNDVKYLANLRMFEQGIVPENTTFGRAMLYNIELIEQFLRRVKEL